MVLSETHTHTERERERERERDEKWATKVRCWRLAVGRHCWPRCWFWFSCLFFLFFSISPPSSSSSWLVRFYLGFFSVYFRRSFSVTAFALFSFLRLLFLLLLLLLLLLRLLRRSCFQVCCVVSERRWPTDSVWLAFQLPFLGLTWCSAASWVKRPPPSPMRLFGFFFNKPAVQR